MKCDQVTYMDGLRSYKYVDDDNEISISVSRDGVVELRSNLLAELPNEGPEERSIIAAYNNTINGFESMLMALAGSNFDMASPQMVAAIRTCLDGIMNNDW